MLVFHAVEDTRDDWDLKEELFKYIFYRNVSFVDKNNAVDVFFSCKFALEKMPLTDEEKKEVQKIQKKYIKDVEAWNKQFNEKNPRVRNLKKYIEELKKN